MSRISFCHRKRWREYYVQKKLRSAQQNPPHKIALLVRSLVQRLLFPPVAFLTPFWIWIRLGVFCTFWLALFLSPPLYLSHFNSIDFIDMASSLLLTLSKYTYRKIKIKLKYIFKYNIYIYIYIFIYKYMVGPTAIIIVVVDMGLPLTTTTTTILMRTTIH